jgi:ribonuclease HI
MGFAWIQTHPSSPRLTFQASSSKWPSAYKTELMAVLTAIIVCPSNCQVDIFTDCQSLINKFQEIANYRYTNRRNILKDSHSYLCCIIYETIILLKLTVNFHKVPAHSDNPDNNQAHAFASQAYQFSGVHLTDVPTIHLPFLPTWQGYVINTHHRHFIRSISKLKGHMSWTMHSFNERYLDLAVDWPSTLEHFNHDEPTYETSMKASYSKSCKIKTLLETLPVMSKMQALRPHVYDASWSRCIKCNQQQESFQHIWICPKTIEITHQIVQAAQQRLLDLVLQHKRPEVQDLTPLTTSAMWFVPLNGHNSHHFSFLDLIKGIVPQQFKHLVLSCVLSPAVATQIISIIMDFIFHATRDFIWLPRCKLIKEKELSLGITLKQKRSPTTGNYMPRTPQGLDAFNELDTSKWDFEVHAFINYCYNSLDFSLRRNQVVFCAFFGLDKGGLVEHMCCFRLVY